MLRDAAGDGRQKGSGASAGLAPAVSRGALEEPRPARGGRRRGRLHVDAEGLAEEQVRDPRVRGGASPELAPSPSGRSQYGNRAPLPPRMRSISSAPR
jgi:hypothetical protein